jgi:putative endonuclease
MKLAKITNPKNTTQAGRIGEDLARSYLEKKGYYIWDQNWSCKAGELDLIARHERSLVFVEVKSRRIFQSNQQHSDYTSALDSYDISKHNQINKLVEIYLSSHKVRLSRERVRTIRIDLVAIDYRLRFWNFLPSNFPKICSLSHFEAVWDNKTD